MFVCVLVFLLLTDTPSYRETLFELLGPRMGKRAVPTCFYIRTVTTVHTVTWTEVSCHGRCRDPGTDSTFVNSR